MGDAFTNWNQTSVRARDYQESLLHDAEAFRRSHAARRRSVFSAVLDTAGRALIAIGRSLREAAGDYTPSSGRHATH